MMDEDEFIDCMSKDFPHLKVTKNELARPTKHFIMHYYSSMLEQITRMSVRALCNFTEEQQDFLTNSVVGHSVAEHVSSHNLYMAVKYIFDKIAVITSEFHYSDILFPSLTPRRSFVFMTTLYDFFTTCAEFDACYEELCTVDSKKQILAQLKQEQARLKEQMQINEEQKILFSERVKDIKEQLANLSSRNDEDQLAIKELQAEEDSQMEKFHALESQEREFQDVFSKIDNERKYYESLVVSDDNKIFEHHGKLQKKKEECFLNLRRLEQQVHDGSSKLGLFDRVLSLYDVLNEVLRGDITFEGKTFDLKGLYVATNALKKEGQLLEKEEVDLQVQLREKDEAVPCSQNELARLDSEKDSITCTWKEKQGRYRSLLNDLQRTLSEFTHRAQIEEAGFKDTARKLNQLSTAITEKKIEIKKIDEASHENFLRFENELISILCKINNEALSYKQRMQNMD